MQFNRGEWSELYALLELLDNQDLNIVDDELKLIDNNTFKVLGLYIQNSNNEYYFDIKDVNVEVLKNNNVISNVDKDEIRKYKDILLNKILHELPGNGSFPIEEMKYILQKLTEGNKIKSSSRYKEDISANLRDNRINTIVNKVGYSIKSSLGIPATLLNASNNTNFKYKLKGLNDSDIAIVNNINTRTKLIDRLRYINDKKAKIEFEQVVSNVFNQNLQMIDSRLPEILADLLLSSYETGEKRIEELLKVIANKNIVNYLGDTHQYYKKKIGDFLVAVTLGLMPGEIWSGEYSVTGGIILVENNGEILVLDAIYYKEYLIRYLIRNTKLDSPSSTRYKMFDIYDENGEKYFNLNLQIRFLK